MSTVSLDYDETTETAGAIQYRRAAGAIIGLVLGLLSLVTLVAAGSSLEACLLVTPIPIAGLILSLRSLKRINGEPDVYTGDRFALAGAGLSILFLVTGVVYGSYVHVTEVPADHTRIAFPLRPDERQGRAGLAVSPEILALDGKQVFIKGYMRPPSTTNGIDHFLLVRDNNQCCFGDINSVKYYDQMQVDLRGTRRLNYSVDKVYAIGGVLRVMPQNVGLGPQPVFELYADYAK